MRTAAYCRRRLLGTFALPLATGAIGFITGVLPALARQPFIIPNELPDKYPEMHRVLYGLDPENGWQVTDEMEAIPPYLENAQCGGYAPEGTSVEGRIATVTGVPGRRGEWNAALTSGMAMRADANGDGDRDNDFLYPDEAEGLSVANYANNPACEDIVRQIRDGRDEGGNNTGPPGCHTPGECSDMCSWANGFRYSVGFQVHQCEHIKCESVCQTICRTEPDPAAPENSTVEICEEQCSEVCTPERYNATDENYYANRGAEDQFDCSTCIAGDTTLPDETGPEPAGEKFVCTGDVDEMNSGILSVKYGWVWGDIDGSAIMPTLPQCRRFWIDERTEYPNCTNCGREDNIELPGETEPGVKNERTPGEECRCGTTEPAGSVLTTAPGGTQLANGCRLTERMSPLNGTEYRSFFRTYPGAYKRDEAVPIVSGVGEVLEKEAPAICFGFYEEFDPKKRQTLDTDQRCVIDADVSQMPLEQIGRGSYPQPNPLSPPDPDDPANFRPQTPLDPNFFQPRDRWFMAFGGAFSLLSQPVFDGNLASALLSIDAARLTAMPFASGMPWPKNSMVRAIDDTGQERTVARWMQKEETLAQSLFARPSDMRIILPAPEALGLSPNDPLFNASVLTDAPTNKRSAAVSIQVSTEGGILDTAVAALQRAFHVHIGTVRVPVVVPMGSPTEYRMLSERWCVAWMLSQGAPDCSSAPSDIQALRSRLEEYAQRIEDVRKLRAELPYAVGKALQAQADIYSPIAEWMQENIARYRVYVERRQRVLALLPRWEAIQEKLRTFEEKTNQPWCMSRAFTTPVYSLLDPWLPGRVSGGSVFEKTAGASLPSLPEVLRKDVVLDISEMRLDGGGFLAMPVFDETQVKLALLDYQPLSDNIAENVPSPPPSLPSLDPALAAMRMAADSIAAPPVIVLGRPPVLDLPPMPTDEELAKADEALTQMESVVDEMSTTYKDFWKSIGPLKPDQSDFDETSQDKIDHRCEVFGKKACQHVEMDLYERYGAIGSRLGVLLDEDLLRAGLPRMTAEACLPEDDTCEMLPPTAYPARTGWQSIGNVDIDNGDAASDTLRAMVRAPLLPSQLGELPEDAYPPYAAPRNDLVPSLRVPSVIRLDPEPPSTLTTP